MNALVIDSPGASPLPEAKLATSQWRQGATTTAIEIPPGTDVIVFFDCQPRLPNQAAHLADGRRVRGFIEGGGVFVAFIAEPDGYRLGNLIADRVEIVNDATHAQQPKNFIPADGPFFEWFSKHAAQFNASMALVLAENLAPVTLATHRTTGRPIAQMAAIGAGVLVVLPVPSDPTTPAAEAIEIAQGLVEIPPGSWLGDPTYWLPQFRVLKTEETTIEERFAAELEDVRERQARVQRDLQGPAEGLLTDISDDLVQAAIWALQQLGINAVDVDKFRTPPKEEDLWLAAGPLEAASSPAKTTHLAEVKGYRNRTCSDDDLGALTKYLHRRGQEWKRSDLRGLMIVNHMSGRAPRDRQAAFSASQIADAERDNVGLVSALTLFEALQKHFAKEVPKRQIQQLLLERSGLVSL